MADEKISVIVPVMNAETYLRECLNSIRRQTYKNLEVIMIYTESTDKTYDICKEYEKLDDRFVFVENNTGLVGPGVSRNIGLDNMTGSLHGFVDADDCIADDMFESMYKNMVQYDADISICKETRSIQEIKDENKKFEVTCLNRRQAIAEFFVGSKFFAELWNKLFKNSCTKNIKFSNTGIGEDLLYVWEALQKADKIIYSSKKDYFYRYNPNGMSKQFKLENIERRIEIYDMIEKDVLNSYPDLSVQFYNRRSIVNAQNYVAYCFGNVLSEKLKKQILINRKKYRFKKDKYLYNKKEMIQARLFYLSPPLLIQMFRLYTKFRNIKRQSVLC